MTRSAITKNACDRTIRSRVMLFTILLGILMALLVWGGVAGFAIVAVWLAGGGYMLANSRSRGLYADATFLLSWPIHLLIER